MSFTPPAASAYPVTLEVDYPDRQLNRLTTFFRLIMLIPIVILLATLTGGATATQSEGANQVIVIGGTGTGLLFVPPLLMLLFRRKYPLWWAAWNRELLRFSTRVGVYVALLDDQYPSTDEQQSLHLDFPDPDGAQLSRWLPLVKWFLAIPHYIVLFFLAIGAIIAVILAWFAILFTGRYPRGLFDYVVGTMRWATRVQAYAFLLVTDRYPPFRLSA